MPIISQAEVDAKREGRSLPPSPEQDLPEMVTMSEEKLLAIIETTSRRTSEKTVKGMLAELNIKGSPEQSGRVYRTTMVDILGRRGYDEAVRKGWLRIQKHDHQKSNSRIYSRREDWERFLKIYKNEK